MSKSPLYLSLIILFISDRKIVSYQLWVMQNYFDNFIYQKDPKIYFLMIWHNTLILFNKKSSQKFDF